MEQVVFTTHLLESNLSDESGITGSADGIFFPGQADELTAAFEQAAQRHAPITLQGARTGFCGLAVPHGGYVINLSKMDQALRFEFHEATGEASITVQAGMTLETLNQILMSKPSHISFAHADSCAAWERYRQSKTILFFPPNPTESSASIGGMVATGASGSHLHFYGDIRDRVLSAYAVGFDGRQTGWDAFAPEGAPAVLAECTLKLAVKPAYTYGLLIFCEAYGQLLSFLQKLEAAIAGGAAFIASADFFDRSVFQMVREKRDSLPSLQALPNYPAAPACALWLELCAQEEVSLFRLLERAMAQMEAVGIQPDNTMFANNTREFLRLQGLRHAVTESANLCTYGRQKQLLETVVPIRRYPALLSELSNALADAPTSGLLMGHAGACNFQLRLLAQTGQEEAQAAAVLARWKGAV